MKMNDMRAPRTRIVLEADAVVNAESKRVVINTVRVLLSSGVCVVGMYENTQSRNLGGPIRSVQGRNIRSRLQEYFDGEWEVRWLHSTEEVR